MTRPLILHIAPTPFFADRGCHIRIAGIVKCLSELGYENQVCTYHHGRDIDAVTTHRISPIKAYTQTEAGPNKYKLWADLKLLWLCLCVTWKAKPQSIHAHLHEGLLIGLIVKILLFWRRLPLVADMQGSLTGELQSHGSFKKWPVLKWPIWLIEKCLMFFPNHIFCSSEQSLHQIKSVFKVPEQRISLAQDGADSFDNIDSSKSDLLRAELQLPADKIIVLYSGALLQSKGLDVLTQLIKSVAAHADRLHFLIIGYPKDNIIPFLEQHNLTALCTLTGQVKFETLSNYLMLADIAIDPKQSDAGEGSGKMLNYLAAGLPIIAFNHRNNKAFINEAIPLANNQEALTELLINYLNMPELRKKHGENNLQHFLSHYSWQVTKQQLLNFYTLQSK